MGIRRNHIETDAVEEDDVLKGAIPIEKIPETTLQSGEDKVSFPFAVAGVEEVTATITFPKAFPTGKVPHVTFVHNNPDLTVVLDAKTETNFTLRAKDNLGVDFTSAQLVTINWTAIVPR